MELTIGMLVGGMEKQKKYQEVIERLLFHEPFRINCLFYDSLEHLCGAMLCDRVSVDILILPASAASFAFAKRLRTLDRRCLILYPARDMSLVLQAFESMPMAYVPAQGGSPGTLEKAVLRAAHYVKGMRSDITFETKSAILQYSLQEIDYFESQYRVVHIVKQNQKRDTITARLDNVQQRLPESFYRCHQSFLVNMENVEHIDKSNREIYLRSGQRVPSSKKLFPHFLEAFRTFQGGGEDAGIL